MLDVFDVFLSAHNQQGHLKSERTLAALKPQYYSATYDLVKLFVEDCAVCHQKNSGIEKKKGARKPIISSEFRDRFQVDLIDMRTIRRRDVYGNMMHWIMTVKDHSTGLIYLVALPRKMAKYVRESATQSVVDVPLARESALAPVLAMGTAPTHKTVNEYGPVLLW